MPDQPTPEQIAAFQEKLKSMTPEQIRELQKQQCIFCKIISGQVPSKKVYEDDQCVAILDINPANPGHLLLMPKEHADILPQLSDNVRNHLARITKRLSLILLRSLNQSHQIDGTSIVIANGQAAGQRATHMMIHIIPRKKDDGIGLSLPQKDIPDAIAQQTKDKLIPLLTGSRKTALTDQPIPNTETSQQAISRSDLDNISNILAGAPVPKATRSPIDISQEGSSVEFEQMEATLKKKRKPTKKSKRVPKDLADALEGK